MKQGSERSGQGLGSAVLSGLAQEHMDHAGEKLVERKGCGECGQKMTHE